VLRDAALCRARRTNIILKFWLKILDVAHYLYPPGNGWRWENDVLGNAGGWAGVPNGEADGMMSVNIMGIEITGALSEETSNGDNRRQAGVAAYAGVVSKTDNGVQADNSNEQRGRGGAGCSPRVA